MPMSSGGHVASSSGCVTRPKAREIGSTGYAVPIQPSSPIGRYVMATAEHREPCDSRGSCTVLGAPGGETPPGDSSATMAGRSTPTIRPIDEPGPPPPFLPFGQPWEGDGQGTSRDPYTNGDNHVRTTAKATPSRVNPRSPRQTSAAP